MRHVIALVRRLAVIIVVLAPAAPAHAQGGFTDAGSVVHLTTNSDRVGIGTSTPGAKLHVTGSVLVGGVVTTTIVSSGAGADLRFRAEGVDAFRLERTVGTPNVIGGARVNGALEGVEGATIGGGGNAEGPSPNTISDNFGTIGGGHGNLAGDERGTNQDAEGATVGGGISNAAAGTLSTIGGGQLNITGSFAATVSGGQLNVAGSPGSTVGGGQENASTGDHSTIGGGRLNEARGIGSTIAGGKENAAAGEASTVGGGQGNIATGFLATIPGGRNVRATHDGAFVWADASSSIEFGSEADSQFRIRSTGGAQFVSAIDEGGAPLAGVTLAAGGGSWASISDRSLKENVAAVDGADILRRLSAIPVTRWNLKAQNPAITHLGPMAQDVYAAFGLGEDERYINSADVDGIALISIQALHQLVTALQHKTAELDRKTADLDRIAAGVEELRARMTRFEQAAAAR